MPVLAVTVTAPPSPPAPAALPGPDSRAQRKEEPARALRAGAGAGRGNGACHGDVHGTGVEAAHSVISALGAEGLHDQRRAGGDRNAARIDAVSGAVLNQAGHRLDGLGMAGAGEGQQCGGGKKEQTEAARVHRAFADDRRGLVEVERPHSGLPVF